MKGSGSEGGTSTVLVHEYVTGGGFAGREVPPSWAAEGAAMRRAIVEDFAAVPGVRVVSTFDQRFPWQPPPGVETRLVTAPGRASLSELAAEADYTLAIAPEADGLLMSLARTIEMVGSRSLGSDPSAIGRTAHKDHLAAHFQARGIPTPPTRIIEASGDCSIDWEGPTIIKPADGAGSVDTFVLGDSRRLPTGLEPGRKRVAQPYLPGAPMSASFLVDRDRRAALIAVGRQRIEVDAEGRVHYRGGTVPAPTGVDLAEVARAVDSVPGLHGFVGVDFLDDGSGRAVILEINPRATTSYVGLARLLPSGTIAGAWLAAIATGLAGTDWPDRLRAARDRPPVGFEADGSTRTEGSTRR